MKRLEPPLPAGIMEELVNIKRPDVVVYLGAEKSVVRLVPDDEPRSRARGLASE